MTAAMTRVLPVVRSQASGAPIWSSPQSWLKRGSLGIVDGTQRSSSRSTISRTGARRHLGERADGIRIGREKGHMAVTFRKLVCDTVNTAGVGAQTVRRAGGLVWRQGPLRPPRSWPRRRAVFRAVLLFLPSDAQHLLGLGAEQALFGRRRELLHQGDGAVVPSPGLVFVPELSVAHRQQE